MPSRKLPEKVLTADIFGLEEHDFIIPIEPRVVQESLAIFNMLKMRPPVWQIGHRFFDRERRGYFYAMTNHALRIAVHLTGTRLYWMPTVDEILRHAYDNEITVSFYQSKAHKRTSSRIYVHDKLFGKDTETEMNKTRYVSYDPWTCFIVGLARGYKRRIEEFGIESIRPTIYTTEKAIFDNPLHLVDQGRKLSSA